MRDNLNYLKGLLDGTASTTLAISELQVLQSYYTTTNTQTRLVQIAGVWYLTVNAAYAGGGVWNRDNVSEVAWLYRLGGLTTGASDNFLVQRAAPAANPITWTTHFQIDSAGKLTGAGFWSSGVFALAAGATAGLSNPFGGATPRFVFGKYQAGTQTEASTTIPIGYGPASTEKVRLTVASGASVTVVSTDSVSNSVIVYAIL